MAQYVEHQTLAQVMILWLEGSSPASGSVLTAWSPLQIMGLPSMLLPTCTLSPSLSKINNY